MTKSPKLNQKQSDLAVQLSRYGKKIKSAYLGSIFAIQQEEYPDRLVHFAQSLREVIDLLARSKQAEEQQKKPIKKSIRKRLLESVIDPVGKQAYDPGYQELSDIYDELSSIAHHKTEISYNESCHKLSIIEDILYRFTMPQITINEEIDNILVNPPSLKAAKRLMELQFRWATRSQLSEKLPQEWLPLMIEVEFFMNPSPATSSHGKSQFPHWIPSTYLIKCTNDFPKKVSELILSCKFKTPLERNPAVYVDFLVCALNLPLASLAKIGKKMLDEKWHDFVKNYWFAQKYVDVMEKLFLNGQSDIAIQMACKIFSPTVSSDPHWFEETIRNKIPNLSQKNPRLIIKLLADLLEDHITMDNQNAEITNNQYDCWRSAIENSDQNWSSGNKSLLVTHLRDCLLDVGNVDILKLRPVMSFLHEKNYHIFRRLELYIYSKFPNEYKREIIFSILWYFGKTNTHHEYHNLIKDTFATLPCFVQQKIFELIDNGPDSNIFDDPNKNDEEKEKYKKYWKLRHFESIKDDLDERHNQIYRQLINEIGSIEHPEYLFYSDVSIGQPSTDPQLFAGKSTDEIFDIVKNYVVSNAVFSFEDKTAETFGEYVENNPLECSKRALELECVDSHIQYQLFSGMSNALQNNKNIEWDGVLSLIEHVVSSVCEGNPYVSKLYDHVFTIYSLLKEGLKKDAIKFELKERLWEIIKQLVDLGTQFPEDYTDYPNNQTDPLTMSLNNIDGLSFHILYQYAMWVEKHSTKKRFLTPEAKQIFDDYLDKGFYKHTISRHAVLGVFLYNFYYLDKDWVKTILEKISSSKNTKIAFWEGYVSWNQLDAYVFSDLYKWYDEFLNTDIIQNLERKQSHQSTIDHVSLAYLYDLPNADKLFEKFLKNTGESSLEHCVFQIGIIIDGKNKDTKFNKEKLIKLWEHPSTLSQNLDGWFRDSPLDKKTTISLYLNYVKKYPKKFNFIYTSISELNLYVDGFPSKVAECLEFLIDKQESNHIQEDEIRIILKSLLKLDDESVIETCKSIREKLAQLGIVI